MSTPDITPGAIVSLLLGLITNVIVLIGLNITDAQKGAITGLVTAVVLAAFLIHDAVIRNGRAKAAATLVSSKVEGPVSLPSGQ